LGMVYLVVGGRGPAPFFVLNLARLLTSLIIVKPCAAGQECFPSVAGVGQEGLVVVCVCGGGGSDLKFILMNSCSTRRPGHGVHCVHIILV
jgi:hypothetical protein